FFNYRPRKPADVDFSTLSSYNLFVEEINICGLFRRERTTLTWKMGDWRLEDCTLFVTLEPCPMCAGAIINARVGTLVFGAREAQTGACGSVIDLFFERFGHRPRVYAGVRGEDCAALLRDFFRTRRDAD
ncbi:MAG: nucleoside deaminase, partial [Oscillospiraceae bacterium]|nr:nucleoside deaminase [Oscillospiraceae bacterium]